MSLGEPLNDADRYPWLERVGKELASHNQAVVACSALKIEYRKIIRNAAPDAHFVYLHGNRELLLSRLNDRADHFMPVTLLDSQLETLEELIEEEKGTTISVELQPEEIVGSILNYLKIRQ